VDKHGIFREIVDLLGTMDIVVDSGTIRFDDTPFKAYGMDSLTQIRLAGEVEERFGITITDSDAFTATSFTRLVDLVDHKLGAYQGEPS
jgi:acyl carrier protein